MYHLSKNYQIDSKVKTIVIRIYRTFVEILYLKPVSQWLEPPDRCFRPSIESKDIKKVFSREHYLI